MVVTTLSPSHCCRGHSPCRARRDLCLLPSGDASNLPSSERITQETRENRIPGLYVLPRSNSNVRRILDALGRWSRPLYTPLIAAEAILYAGFEEKYSYFHLVFPVGYLVLTELLKKNIKSDMLDLSTILNSVSICYSSFLKEDAVGALCALLNLTAFMGTSYNSMEYFVLIAAANLAAVQFFKQLLF
ncbi:uncharacterized protein LOC124352824 isoform X1 [Homalodisca vitripennis]|uniref:uncharacterized protein LOC124352824 isoform X1 n=1 Tax=Homalodisca vitripennis TaxID=197043 RepID=UPI001EE9C1C4|nr:uncharacterized protein LOC124352824 isoform X1 [Homalodisca vitripennis]XP_046658474.1 uncharacterized protein LOC124352824 isoform X1 [Homalodisca vitripennis]